MVDGRLLRAVPQSRRFVIVHVAAQWIGLFANVAIMLVVTDQFAALLTTGQPHSSAVLLQLVAIVAALVVRAGAMHVAAQASYGASRVVKLQLRHQIFDKLLRLGPSYARHTKTSEVVQLAVEGIEQLEAYFGSYLPQLFYATLAPITLFMVLAPVSLRSAVVLLLCVPLIPVSIALVQTFAKRLLGRYWKSYTDLGDQFLELLQGLTTLKIYDADERYHQAMNSQAEAFRRMTMRVLTMQLNSITIMDVIAYGGTALGIALAVFELQAGVIDVRGCLLVIALSADFFLPMRLLGSYFHIAMNGMAAADRMFSLFELDEPQEGYAHPRSGSIELVDLGFSYEKGRQALSGVNAHIPEGQLTALVGESGCGKSTLAAVLLGRLVGYTGHAVLAGDELSSINTHELANYVTYVGAAAYLFKGTVESNLRMAAPDASDEELWEVLTRTGFAEYVRTQQGLATEVHEGGSNLSGGQRQRLAVARALLRKSPLYIFDEATSSIDVESEQDLSNLFLTLAGDHTVIVIAHRLANVVQAHQILAMDKGAVVESGTHDSLLTQEGLYARLWKTQQELESRQTCKEDEYEAH